MTFRAIETASFAKVKAATTFGRPPKLEWLPIKQLIVDPEYQRGIVGKGRKYVARIAEEFDWSKFTPVIVAGIGSNKFAIVDGQHRVTAAVLCGIEKVPCAVLDMSRAEQASAFSAINGNVTRLSSIQIHHAACAAGQKDALAVAKVCKAAGAIILRYPKDQNKIDVGETMAIVAIGRTFRKFGAGVTEDALRAIIESGGGTPGTLRGPVIHAVAEVLADHPTWRGNRLKSAFEDIDLCDMLLSAAAAAARTRGTSRIDHLEAALIDLLGPYFGKTKAA